MTPDQTDALLRALDIAEDRECSMSLALRMLEDECHDDDTADIRAAAVALQARIVSSGDEDGMRDAAIAARAEQG